jgi:hypothetical protein
MGSEVAEAVSEEFICIDPRSSDNEVVIDEEPVVPENLYDGGSESEDDSVSSSIKPQPALGSPLSHGSELTVDFKNLLSIYLKSLDGLLV